MGSYLAELEAERTNRIAVTVARFAASELNGDENAYWFSEANALDGTEPWNLIEGVDTNADSTQFDVWFASGKCKAVDGEHEIYISRKHVSRLGVEVIA